MLKLLSAAVMATFIADQAASQEVASMTNAEMKAFIDELDQDPAVPQDLRGCADGVIRKKMEGP